LLWIVPLFPPSPSPAEALPCLLLAPITPAEDRVLQLVRRGDSNRSIAAELLLSPRTVESHVSSLLAKTGCHSRSQLLLWALGQPTSRQPEDQRHKNRYGLKTGAESLNESRQIEGKPWN
jgi:DNA-binding CsgD family transcriptional regulator